VGVGGVVLGDGFVGLEVVVVVPVCVDLIDELEFVFDFFTEQLLVFHRSEAVFAGAVLARGSNSGSHVPQLGVRSDERLEGERPEWAAVAGHDRDDRHDLAGLRIDQGVIDQGGERAEVRLQPARARAR